MSRSIRHTPIAWYAACGPNYLRFVKQYNAGQRRAVTRGRIAHEDYDNIWNWHPCHGFDCDAKEGRHWWSEYDMSTYQYYPRMTWTDTSGKHHQSYIRPSYDRQADNMARRRKWMRK